MAGHDIVAIGGSAGGFVALEQIIKTLPADFPAAVFVVLHLNPNSPSVLPALLGRMGKLPASHPADGETIRPGHIYVARPDHHLLLRPGKILLRRSPHENRTRPAVNPLFRSAAIAYRSRVIGVLLSGMLDDGAAGMTAIRQCGGIAVVQDPDDAVWGEMPRNALRQNKVEHVAPAASLGSLLNELVHQPAGPMPPIPDNLIAENRIVMQDWAAESAQIPIGRPTSISCPQCGGVLNEVPGPGATPFRCQIGHAFTADGLRAAQDDQLEMALESALRIHRDRQGLFRRMQERSEANALPHSADHWRRGADESEQAAALIAQAIARLRHMTAAGC